MSDIETRLKALMLESLTGNAKAYGHLLQELSLNLRSYYRRRLFNGGADAEDLVQETLIAIDRRRASYDPSQPFTPWVFAIARYRMVDHLRRVSIRETVPLDGMQALFGSDESDQVAAEMDVERLLAELPDRQQEAIRMTRIEGRSIEEVAQRTGQSESAVKVGVHRGLKRLRATLLGDDTNADQ